jgi:hypothetical protein
MNEKQQQQQQQQHLLRVRKENLGQKDQEVDVTGISVLLSNIQLPVLKFACKIYHHLLGKYQPGQVSFDVLYVFPEDIRRNFTLSLYKCLAPSLFPICDNTGGQK